MAMYRNACVVKHAHRCIRRSKLKYAFLRLQSVRFQHIAGGYRVEVMGAQLSADIAGGPEAACAFIDRCKGIKFVPSLAGVSTTLSYPAKTSHRGYTPEELKRAGISAGQIRFSIGLEDPTDILGEFDRALANL